MELIKTYKEFIQIPSTQSVVRNKLRELTLLGLALNKSIFSTNNWIRCPYYHHVFDDERKDFERQLKYLRNYGDFISMDEVQLMLSGELSIDGRYFCISFDDGYRCLYDNMLPITYSMNIPVIIYLPTDYVDLNENNPADIPKIVENLPGSSKILSFLSWSQCRDMLTMKISFGSHTKTHARLSLLSNSKIEEELKLSKHVIEEELKSICKHFACPWGRINLDFNSKISIPIAKQLGYSTFSTTNRGKMTYGDSPYLIRRDHILSNWSNYQLKYFFSK